MRIISNCDLVKVKKLVDKKEMLEPILWMIGFWATDLSDFVRNGRFQT